MAWKEVTQVKEYLWKMYLFQAENPLDYLINLSQVDHLKWLGMVMKSQVTSSNWSKISTAQNHR